MTPVNVIDASFVMIWNSDADGAVERRQGAKGNIAPGECVSIDIGGQRHVCVASTVSEHFTIYMIGPHVHNQPAMAARWLYGE